MEGLRWWANMMLGTLLFGGGAFGGVWWLGFMIRAGRVAKESGWTPEMIVFVSVWGSVAALCALGFCWWLGRERERSCCRWDQRTTALADGESAEHLD